MSAERETIRRLHAAQAGHKPGDLVLVRAGDVLDVINLAHAETLERCIAETTLETTSQRLATVSELLEARHYASLPLFRKARAQQ
jgi:hypothetical protein